MRVDTQAPPEHAWLAPQTLPALPPMQSAVAPQWLLSFAGLVHSPPQTRLPDAQPQVPALQVCEAAHALPQVPQFETSAIGSLQVPLQRVSVALAQLSEHCPCEHDMPSPQALPQTPQLARSLIRLAQAPAHTVSFVLHVAAWQYRLFPALPSGQDSQPEVATPAPITPRVIKMRTARMAPNVRQLARAKPVNWPRESESGARDAAIREISAMLTDRSRPACPSCRERGRPR